MKTIDELRKLSKGAHVDLIAEAIEDTEDEMEISAKMGYYKHKFYSERSEVHEAIKAHFSAKGFKINELSSLYMEISWAI